MDYRNEKHRIAFTEAIRKLNKKDYALMSAVYLLTVEHALWMTVKRNIGNNIIRFDEVKLQNSTENAYTLLPALSLRSQLLCIYGRYCEKYRRDEVICYV